MATCVDVAQASYPTEYQGHKITPMVGQSLAPRLCRQADLSAMNPQRVCAMAAQWEAFAKRAHVLPWPWKPGYGAKDQ